MPPAIFCCSEQKNAMLSIDLQGHLYTWCLASLGLPDLSELDDLTCLHASTRGGGNAGLDSRGFLRCGSPSSWIPSWASTTFPLRSLWSHVPAMKPSCRHYCTEVLEGDERWIFDDGNPPVKRLWYLRTTCLQGGLILSPTWPRNLPIQSDEEKVNYIIQNTTNFDEWNHTWLKALDSLDAGILVVIQHPVTDLLRKASCAGVSLETQQLPGSVPLSSLGCTPGPEVLG